MDLMAIVRAVHMSATVLTVGAFAFQFLIARFPDNEEPARRVRSEVARWLQLASQWGVSLALASWLIWLLLVGASMSGRPLSESTLEVVRTVLTRTTFGQVWTLRFALMVLLGGDIFRPRRASAGGRELDMGGACLAVGLLLTLAGAGHAIGTERSVRPIHLTADALHLLGAGLWLGALVPLLFVLGRARSVATDSWRALAALATRRFSAMGLLAVVTLLVTGLINAWLLVGSFPALIQTRYGELVSAKLALFACILFVAAFNRIKLVPRLPAERKWEEISSRAVLERLWYNVIAEICLGVAIVAIVGVLGTTTPSFHGMEPVRHHMHAAAGNVDKNYPRSPKAQRSFMTADGGKEARFAMNAAAQYNLAKSQHETGRRNQTPHRVWRPGIRHPDLAGADRTAKRCSLIGSVPLQPLSRSLA